MNSTTYNTLLFLLGTLVLVSVTSAIEEESENNLCDLPAAKRMLQGLGVGDRSKCLLLKKRDISRLVASYLENSIDNEDKLDALVEALDSKTIEEKRAAYCCSPVCDKFMARMGKPNAALIRCN